MNLKNAVAAVSLSGGLELTLLGVGSGVAYAAPGGGGCMPPSCGGGPGPGGLTPVLQARRGRVASVGRVVPRDVRGPGAPGDFGRRPPDAFGGFRGAYSGIQIPKKLKPHPF